MFKKLMNTVNVLVCAILIVQLMGCGTIFYPERKGQTAGRLDVGVVLLDGLGLLFFLIPGVIAFAVDFNNGTIYLPGGAFSRAKDLEHMKQVKFDPKTTNRADIEKIIKEQTGRDVKLDQADMEISKLRSTDDMAAQFSKVLSYVQNDNIALLGSVR